MSAPVPMRLKAKYLTRKKVKFGGKKRSTGNSQPVGRSRRRSERPRVVSQWTSGEQYTQWVRAGSPVMR